MWGKWRFINVFQLQSARGCAHVLIASAEFKKIKPNKSTRRKRSGAGAAARGAAKIELYFIRFRKWREKMVAIFLLRDSASKEHESKK